MRRYVTIVGAVAMVLAWVSGAQAVNMQTVTVGNPGNAGELSGAGAGGWGQNRICGAVDYVYGIGTYEVTNAQYTEFLNAVAAVGDPYGLYNAQMWTHYQGCKIERTGSGTAGAPYAYSIAADRANRPVNYIDWGDAARFSNWLTNGQPTGSQDVSSTEDGSYTLNGATSGEALNAVTRNDDARYVIPSEDEWYKQPITGVAGLTLVTGTIRLARM